MSDTKKSDVYVVVYDNKHHGAFSGEDWEYKAFERAYADGKTEYEVWKYEKDAFPTYKVRHYCIPPPAEPPYFTYEIDDTKNNEF